MYVHPPVPAVCRGVITTFNRQVTDSKVCYKTAGFRGS